MQAAYFKIMVAQLATGRLAISPLKVATYESITHGCPKWATFQKFQTG